MPRTQQFVSLVEQFCSTQAREYQQVYKYAEAAKKTETGFHPSELESAVVFLEVHHRFGRALLANVEDAKLGQKLKTFSLCRDLVFLDKKYREVVALLNGLVSECVTAFCHGMIELAAAAGKTESLGDQYLFEDTEKIINLAALVETEPDKLARIKQALKQATPNRSNLLKRSIKETPRVLDRSNLDKKTKNSLNHANFLSYQLPSVEDVRITSVNVGFVDNEFQRWNQQRHLFENTRRAVSAVVFTLKNRQTTVDCFLQEQVGYAELWRNFLARGGNLDYGVESFVTKCQWYIEQRSSADEALRRIIVVFEELETVFDKIESHLSKVKPAKYTHGQKRLGLSTVQLCRNAADLVDVASAAVVLNEESWYRQVSARAVSSRDMLREYRRVITETDRLLACSEGSKLSDCVNMQPSNMLCVTEGPQPKSKELRLHLRVSVSSG